MNRTTKRNLIITLGLFALFLLFTVLVTQVDVRAIGPQGSSVGLASLNGAVFDLLGVNPIWDQVTSILGVVALIVAAAFALIGLRQLIVRRSLWKVDINILLLGVFYLLVIALYILFDLVPVNFRPILVDGGLEASYPSSHTVLSVCVMATAMVQFRRSLFYGRQGLFIADLAAGLIIILTVVGRLLSGVHWFSDIAGGVLLSAALVMLYITALSFFPSQKNKASIK